MCGGMAFIGKNKELFEVYFPQPYPKIEAFTKDNSKIQCIWGRRSEKEFEGSEIPITGWARIEAIKAEKWHKYDPEKVYILPEKYMEKDKYGKSHWFEPPPDKTLVGLLVEAEKHQKVVYVVTVPSPKKYAHIHNRWPMLTKTFFQDVIFEGW